MIDAIFSALPAELFSMNGLAIFLSRLKGAGAISDWHPMCAGSRSKSARYGVKFGSDRDAAYAAEHWAFDTGRRRWRWLGSRGWVMTQEAASSYLTEVISGDDVKARQCLSCSETFASLSGR